MSKPGETDIKRIISACCYSKQGLIACWKMEAAFRQELFACILLIPLAIYLGVGGVEKALLVSSCLLVLIVEVLNSGIEAVVDRVSSEHHELSGLAKDLGSAAVMLSIVNFIVIWILLLLW
ncbi:diacylglycerol kinase [Gammaproteobacteria bacterium]|jgi:diacylglycerol kinase (ATP)|nr:diacylglycerol kinase [Gammaproteobacteria bacterium]